jgi:hypothetical protein
LRVRVQIRVEIGLLLGLRVRVQIRVEIGLLVTDCALAWYYANTTAYALRLAWYYANAIAYALRLAWYYANAIAYARHRLYVGRVICRYSYKLHEVVC